MVEWFKLEVVVAFKSALSGVPGTHRVVRAENNRTDGY